MSQKKTKKDETKKKRPAPMRNPDGTFAKGNDFSEKYDEKYADALIEFFSGPLTRVEYKRTYKDGQLTSETPVEFTCDFPTMGMFARSIGVSVSALKDWAGITKDGEFKKPRFASAYARVKEWAGGMMESGALSGKLDANMAKFVLTNDYGKQDKQIVENTFEGLSDRDREMMLRVERRLAGEGNGDEQA